MLEHLFGSKTRVKLLSLFLRHPNEAIFVRELTRRIDTQINAVRRELANLVRFGLISEVVVADVESTAGPKRAGLKRKYYQVNHTFSLLPEITSLIVKAQLMLEQQLDQHILKLGDVRYLAFMGLFLSQPQAPVDIFLIGERIDKKAMDKLLVHTEAEFGVEFGYSLMTIEEFHYRKDITDRFLYAILEAPKNVIIDKLAERVK